MKPGPGRFVLGHQLSSRPGPEYFLFLSNLNFCFQHPQKPRRDEEIPATLSDTFCLLDVEKNP